MFKLLGVTSFLFALLSATQPFHPALGFQNNFLAHNIGQPVHFGGIQNNFGHALSYVPYAHPAMGYNPVSPIFMGPAPVQQFANLNRGYAHPGAIGNPYAPISNTRLSNSRQLTKNNVVKTNPLRQAVLSKYRKAYAPTPVRRQISMPLQMAGLNPQFRGAMRPQNVMNRAMSQPSINKNMFIPTYMQNMPGYNMSNMPSAFRAGYQKLPSRTGRSLRQKKQGRSLKLDINDKANKMTPEQVTLALKKQIVNMRKLIDSMGDKPGRSIEDKLDDMDNGIEKGMKSDLKSIRNKKLDQIETGSKAQKIDFY